MAPGSQGYAAHDAETEMLDDDGYSEDDYLDPDGDGERESSAGGMSAKRGGGGGRSGSEDASKDLLKAGGGAGDSPKKKPRVTLARGGACVACRNRKL